LLDLVIDRDTAGVLTFVEELAEQGQDMSRPVTDLLEHLRHLMLVQHMGDVPDSLPVTEETRERLRVQANQLGPGEVLRLVDLLAVAVEDMRQGGDPRLPLELALVKITQPSHDLSREGMLLRLEQLEARIGRVTHPMPASHEEAPGETKQAGRPPAQETNEPEAAADEAPVVDFDQLRQAWEPAVLSEVERRSIPTASVLREARPVALEGDRLVLEFAASAGFHRSFAEEPRNAALLAEVLHTVTGHYLTIEFTVGEPAPNAEEEAEPDAPTSEEEFVSLFKDTFDAREVPGGVESDT
jgi:DNA polymerase-3 subunit gamma/tau